MKSMIEVNNLSKKFGHQMALDNVSFTIEPGRIVGLLGRNGAGKTTLINAILGLTQCQGEVCVLGMNPWKERVELMKRLCFISDVAILPRWMTAQQAVDLLTHTHPAFDRKKALNFIKKTTIPLSKKIAMLSKGMVVQLHLSLVMSISADILVLDEPTLGLDVMYRTYFYEALLNDYFDENKSIVLTTHQVDEIEKILSDIMIIDKGRLCLVDSMDAISQRFSYVRAKPSCVESLKGLSPIKTRVFLGEHYFLFDQIDRSHLTPYGDVMQPELSDVFVSIVEGESHG